jgi:hypothetical protein
VGELTVFLGASKDDAFLNMFGEDKAYLMYYFIMSFPVIYAPGALPMIFNMAANRKKAFKKRFAKPAPPPMGLVWPIDKKGGRSSTPVAKEILAVPAIIKARGIVLSDNDMRVGHRREKAQDGKTSSNWGGSRKRKQAYDDYGNFVVHADALIGAKVKIEIAKQTFSDVKLKKPDMHYESYSAGDGEDTGEVSTNTAVQE